MAEETPPMNADEILAAIQQGSAIVCYAKCHSCMFQQCPGGWHTWADDPSDWESAIAAGKPDPREQKCGCHCTDGPELPPYEPDWESINGAPCPVCGSEGECAADDEGRPLIHAITEDVDE